MACSTVVAVTQPVHADPVAAWSYEATPYLHAAGLDGTIGAGRVRAHTDISFSDVLSHLDIALQGQFLARKGPLSLGLDAEYIRLSDDGSRSVTGPEGRATVQGKLDATSTLSILQGTIGYRVLDGQTKVDLVGGLRATGLDADLDLDGSLSVGDAVFGKSRSLSGSREWVDIVGGARISHTISDQVTLSGYVDVGGGGSNLTWQALVGLNWQVAKDYTVKLGYRELSWDYSSGGVVWDMKLHGPYVGLGIRF
jgi:opacity protein-like surface antigen